MIYYLPKSKYLPTGTADVTLFTKLAWELSVAQVLKVTQPFTRT